MLASIQTINNIIPHGNADSLEIAQIGSWNAIVRKDQFKIGQKICFIEPDTLLPQNVEWSKFYLSKSSRVRTIKLRGVYSQGIVESLSNVGLLDSGNLNDLEIGTDVAEKIGVVKWEPPQVQDLNAKGRLPFGIFKTDENNYKSLSFHDPLPFGELVTTTLKIDGMSGTFFCKIINENNIEVGITSRTLEQKLDCENSFNKVNFKYSILEKLKEYCIKNNVSLALRGEVFGNGVQHFKCNPHSNLPTDVKFFNVLNLNTLQYESFETCQKICAELSLPIVPVLEQNVVLTKELIDKYENMEKLNENYFEGVVIKYGEKYGIGKSFKVINKVYDSLK